MFEWFCVLDCWELNKPVIVEDISPGLEEHLPPEIDDRQVPVGVPEQNNDEVL